MSALKKNIIWNFLGSALPLLVGVFVIPALVDSIGIERFGLLAIAWVLVGYFSLFDMGLSRALTQMIAERIDSDRRNEVPGMMVTAFWLMAALGLLGGIVLWFLTPWLVHDLLSIKLDLQPEAVAAFRVLALSIPFVVHTSALRGVLEALHLFKQASLIRLVMGIGTFLGPFLATFYSVSLIYAALTLVLVRLAAWMWHLGAVYKNEVLQTRQAGFDKVWIQPLLTFGGWMTVTNLIGPLMIYLDRFFIGAKVSVSAVAYYVAPYEVLTRLSVVPAAISGVLFPVFARDWQLLPGPSSLLLARAMIWTVALLFPAALMAALFAPEWLNLWLGPAFSEQGAVVAQWLAAGILVNGVAQMLFAMVQGAGRSDWTAKLHLAEVLPYWAGLWFALDQFGIQGAAAAWFFRVLFDALGLVYATGMLHKAYRQVLSKPLLLLLLSIAPVLASLMIDELLLRAILAIFCIMFYGWLSWYYLFKNGGYISIANLFVK